MQKTFHVVKCLNFAEFVRWVDDWFKTDFFCLGSLTHLFVLLSSSASRVEDGDVIKHTVFGFYVEFSALVFQFISILEVKEPTKKLPSSSLSTRHSFSA